MKESKLRKEIRMLGFVQTIRKDVFPSFQMEYFVKDGFLLFYNTPIQDHAEEKFLMGFGEMRMGVHNAVSFRWTSDIEEIKITYESVTGKKII